MILQVFLPDHPGKISYIINCRRIALELHILSKSVVKHSRDNGLLIFTARFFPDDGGKGDKLLRSKSYCHCSGKHFRCYLLPELADHNPDDLFRLHRAVEEVCIGVKKSLQAVTLYTEGVNEIPIGSEIQKDLFIHKLI